MFSCPGGIAQRLEDQQPQAPKSAVCPAIFLVPPNCSILSYNHPTTTLPFKLPIATVPHASGGCDAPALPAAVDPLSVAGQEFLSFVSHSACF
eukprot:1161645-Pelagomonas_calceolata.AAC.18